MSNSPEASLRLAVAVRYWNSARIILGDQTRQFEFMEPVGLLLGMSAELAFKAFLQNAGTREKILRGNRVGHDLGKLLRRSVEKGLEISTRDAQGILVMRTSHLEHFYRYGPMDLSSGPYLINLPEEQKALQIVARIIDNISGDPSHLRGHQNSSNKIEWPETVATLDPITLSELAIEMRAAEERANTIESLGASHKFTD